MSMDIRKNAPSDAFFKLINYKPYPYQRAIHESWALYRTAIIGRQSGKSETAAVEAAFEVLFNIGSTGWVVAPTYEQAEVIYERVAEYVKKGSGRLPGRRVIRSSTRQTRLRVEHYDANGNFLGTSKFQGKSSDNPDNLRGASLNYLIIDEAAMVQEEVWFAALAPTLTTTNGWVLLITTPKGYNWVHNFYKFGLDMAEHPDYPLYTRYASWQLPTWDANPSVPHEFFEQQKAMQPDRVYRQEFGAEFIADSGSVFQGLSECPKAPIIKRDELSITLEPAYVGHSYIVGADFARLDDFSVYTVIDMHARRVCKVQRMNTVSWERQLEYLKQLRLEYKEAMVVADIHGPGGDVLAEQLASMGIPYEGLGFKTNAIKEACINKLAMAIEHKRIRLPDDKEYIDEFSDFIYEKTPSGILKMQAAGRGKDDRVVSLAIAWYFVSEHSTQEIDIPDDAYTISLGDDFDLFDDLNDIYELA